MKPRQIAGLAFISFLLGACSNLSEVARFAGDSATVVGNHTWIQGYYEQLDRKRLYVDTNSAAQQERTLQARQAEDLHRIHGQIEDYLGKLANLADPRLAQFAPALDATRSSITAHPALGIDATVVKAFLDLGEVTFGGVTHLARQRKLKEMIRRGEPEMRKLVGSLITASEKYERSLDEELRLASELFKLERFGNLGSAQPALAAFGKVLYEEKQRAITAQQAEVKRHRLTLAEVSQGHTKLYENLDRLQAKDVVQALLGYRKRIREIQRTLADELAQFK